MHHQVFHSSLVMREDSKPSKTHGISLICGLTQLPSKMILTIFLPAIINQSENVPIIDSEI